MSYPRWTLGAWAVVSLGLMGVTHADDPQLLPRAGVLVLRTDHVMRGNILRVGDRYVVTMNKRDEVSVPVDRVAMHCDSLDDAYRRKRAKLPPGASVADHLRLADWCLCYDLLPAAAEQLMAAQRRAPLDPANERFEKRLHFAAHQTSKPALRRQPAPQVAEQAELDAQLRNLPTGTIAEFTHTIQPLLLNRCGGGSCHGPNAASEFRLLSAARGRTLPRRFTQRNLRAVAELLDPAQPGRSPLLKMSTTAHGGANRPPLSDADVVPSQHLAEWVYKTSKKAGRQPPAVLKTPNTVLLQPLQRRSGAVSDSTATNSAANATPDGNSSENRAATRIDMAVQPAAHQSAVPVTSKPLTATGVDPFDPEVFNRRYIHRKR